MIIRAADRETYAVVSSEVLNDDRLSFKAKGLLTYLLGRPPDWEVQEKQLATVSTDGISSVRSALAELREYGYAEKRKVINADGTIYRWEMAVFERAKSNPEPGHVTVRRGESEPDRENHDLEPDSENPNVDETASEPDSDSPDVDNPREENPDLLHKKDLPNRDSTKERTTTASAGSQAEAGTTDGTAAVDDSVDAMKRYQEILDIEDGLEFLQELFGYHFEQMVEEGEWGSLPSSSSLGAIWMRVLADLGGNSNLARRFIREKLSELDGEGHSRRAVVRWLQEDAGQWLADQQPDNILEFDVGRNDYDDKQSAQEGDDEEPQSQSPASDFPSRDDLASAFEAGERPEPWQSALVELSEKVSSHNFTEWLVGLVWSDSDGTTAHLTAQDVFLQSWVQDNYAHLVTDTLNSVTDGAIDDVEVHTPESRDAAGGAM